ncbi:hypothetical protein Tco_0031480 [Tanacetum coccineum]
MAAPGPVNIIARRGTDDLIAFSGETVVPRYIRFFLDQKISESRRFVTRMHEEAETVRGCIAQLTALVAELQAMENEDEVYNSLLAAKDAKRGEESKLLALNDVIAEALDDIEILETDVEILGGDDNGVYIRGWVMTASAIVISLDSSDDSVGSPPSRIILFGSIPTVIPVIPVISSETLSIFPRYQLLHHFYALILQRLLILLMDNHLRTLMLLSLLNGGARTLTARKSVRPLSSHHLALRYTSHHLDRFTSGSSSGHLSSEHSLSGHSILGHSLSGHTPPDTIVADSSAPPRFVYPPLTRTPQCSEAYHRWRTAPLSTMSLVDSVPSSTPVYGSLAPTRADVLPPRKRFRDSYSSKAIMEEDIKVGTVEAKDTKEYEAETSTGDTVELGIDLVSAPIVDEGIVKPVGYDSSDLSGTRDGIVRSFEDMPINLDDALRDFYHHMYKVHVDRIVEIETVQRQLEVVQLIASMMERIESLRLENLKVRALLGVERDRVDSLRLHMSRSQEEFCQIRKDRDDVRWRFRRLDSFVERRLGFRP